MLRDVSRGLPLGVRRSAARRRARGRLAVRHLPVAQGFGRRRLHPGRREAGPALPAGAFGMRQAREEVLLSVPQDICVSGEKIVKKGKLCLKKEINEFKFLTGV